LAEASVTKTATLPGLSRAAVPKVMMACTDHGKTSSAERNCGRQPQLSERDHHTMMRIVSKHHRTVAVKVTVELDIHLEDRFHKNGLTTAHNSNTHCTAAIAKPLITENNAKRQKRWCDDDKTWMSDDWKYVI
jgi:hypothetical protein